MTEFIILPIIEKLLCQKFGLKQLSRFNLAPLQYRMLEDKNLLAFDCRIEKIGVVHKTLQNIVNYAKQGKVTVIFLRVIPLRIQHIDGLQSLTGFNNKKTIILTSGQVSPSTLAHAHRNNVSVIIPTQLNSILKDEQD